MSIPPEDLPEKKFIHEEYSKNPFPFWLWLAVVIIITCLIWGIGSWYYKKMNEEVTASPFLQVTNRELSLFLWQFPEKMRVNAKNKNGYLPGFQYQQKVSLEVDAADQYAVAPPSLLFLYHTWKRLLSNTVTQRVIPLVEFKQFLDYAEEWQPPYWPSAPAGYAKFVESLPHMKEQDLSQLPLTMLPQEVRSAFQGWKNFFIDAERINQTKLTYTEMDEFLETFPHYARNYWRNIVDDSNTNYLYALTLGQYHPESPIPNNELTPFLRVAFFNWKEVKISVHITKPSS